MPKVRLIRSLDEFTDTEDLEKMWTVMRPEIELRMRRKSYVALPHITDGNCYGVGSVFVKVEDSGMCCCYKCKFLPLGPIEDLVEYETTDYFWHSKHPYLFSATSEMDSCHYFKVNKRDICSRMGDVGFSITLQDPANQKELKLNVDSLHVRPIPLDMDPVNTVVFRRSSNPELEKTNTIYLVTAVKEAERLELSGTIGARTRIYHIIHRYPLFFKYAKYKINEEGKIIRKMRCRSSTEHTVWIRVNKSENIDDIPLPDWQLETPID